MFVAAVVFVMGLGVNLGAGWFREKALEAIDQLFELGIAGEEIFDLGTKVGTFPAGLLVGKYVVVVLHDLGGILCRDHTIQLLITSMLLP
jgi:hypothetical protein